jgi:ferredoxin--NADP+ reductase
MISRRGPAYPKFTTKEPRELGELLGVEIVVHADEADLITLDASSRACAGRIRPPGPQQPGGTTKWARAPPPAGTGHSRRLLVRFWLRPVEILGSERVTGIALERTTIAAAGAFGGAGEIETLDAQMMLRSVGYQSVPMLGVPFDEQASVVPRRACPRP